MEDRADIPQDKPAARRGGFREGRPFFLVALDLTQCGFRDSLQYAFVIAELPAGEVATLTGNLEPQQFGVPLPCDPVEDGAVSMLLAGFVGTPCPRVHA